MLSSQLQAILCKLCKDVSTPRSLAIFLMVKHGEWKQLVSLRCAPIDYQDHEAEAFAADTLVTDFLRKCDFDIPGKGDLKQECWDRFKATEAACHITNLRLERFRIGPLDHRDAPLLPIIDKVRKEVARIVGRLPNSLNCGFGPGSTLTNKGSLTTIPDKIESLPCGTSGAVALFKALEPDNRWLSLHYSSSTTQSSLIARGSRFFTVPKEALKLRGACVSPNVNLYLQKGIGRHLRERLRLTTGIAISDDSVSPLFSINGFTTPDRHRRLAQTASSDGSLATIDLSDASNTISRKLVQLLLPAEWYALLDTCRERMVEAPNGTFHHLEMFSSMGNGFTFELETILFYAITRVVSGSYTSVFGDDIITCAQKAPDVIAALRFFGFTPNAQKTFISGPFRESCGGDYFSGVSVRGVFVKNEPSNPQHWIAMANALRHFCTSAPKPDDRWAYVKRAWFAVLDCIPKPLRDLRGPESLGDAVVHDTQDRWKVRARDGMWQCQGIVFKPDRLSLNHWTSAIVHAAALYGISSEGIIPRRGPGELKRQWLPCVEYTPAS